MIILCTIFMIFKIKVVASTFLELPFYRIPSSEILLEYFCKMEIIGASGMCS